MRIIVEAVGNRLGGGGVVLLEVLDALLKEPRFERIIVLCSPRAERGFDFPVEHKLQVVEQPVAHGSLAARLWWLEYGLSKVTNTERADRVLLLNGVGRVYGNCPVLAFVQQALPFTPAAWRAASWPTKLRMRTLGWLMRQALRRATHVAVQREGMRMLLNETIGLASDRIDVFEPGAPLLPQAKGPMRKLLPMLHVPADRRVLYVGSNEPHKNLQLAVEAVDKASDLFPGAKLFATCPRPRGEDTAECVCWMGSLNRAELRRAYELATVLIMPSKVESFGLPLLEAMSLGVPVLAADLSYARDVCREAAVFFDPNSAADAAAKLGKLLRDSKLQSRLSAFGIELAKRRSAANPYRQLARRIAELD